MGILKNREVKNILIVSSVSFLIFIVVSIAFLNNWFSSMSLRYAHQNIALVGAILDNNPELEDEIIPIITKGKIDEYTIQER